MHLTNQAPQLKEKMCGVWCEHNINIRFDTQEYYQNITKFFRSGTRHIGNILAIFWQFNGKKLDAPV